MGKMQTQYLIDENGQKTAIVLPIEEYEELLKDIQDLAIIAERKDKPTTSNMAIVKPHAPPSPSSAPVREGRY